MRQLTSGSSRLRMMFEKVDDTGGAGVPRKWESGVLGEHFEEEAENVVL
jgi:hypothetical protein